MSGHFLGSGVTSPGPKFNVDTGAGVAKTWLDIVHPWYRVNADKWQFSFDHYTAEAADPSTITTYLIRKAIGEALESYEERVALADYTPHFGALVDSLAGMLFSADSSTKREYGPVDQTTKAIGGLGDPNVKDSIMWQLWADADGEGNGYLTIWKQLAVELITFREAWLLLDVVNDEPVIRMINVLAVTNWVEAGGRPVEVVVRESVDVRASVKDALDDDEQFIVFGLDGWQRWRKSEVTDKNNEQIPVVVTGDDASGSYHYEDRTGRQVLPIFKVRIPLRRNVGYVMARKANAIFNKESERDHLLRVANFPLLNVMGGDLVFDKVKDALHKGSRLLENRPGEAPHDFISPGTESAKVATEVLNRKVDEYYRTGFKEYGDTARERVTATEIRQDVSSGVGAFLSLLKTAVDDAENNIFSRLEQQQFSKDRNAWFIAFVERSEDFLPVDVNQQLESMRQRYFSENAVPVGPTALVAVARKIAELDGIHADEEELKAAVSAQGISAIIDVLAELPVPAEAKASFTIRLLTGLGIIDPNQEIILENQDVTTLGEVIRDKVLEIALEREEQGRRMMDTFPSVGGDDDGDDDGDDE